MIRIALSLLALPFAIGCARQQQRLEHVPVTSRAMNGAHLSYAVYTPPDFAPDERLPVVLFLHGGGDKPRTFEEHGVAQRLDTAIAEGRLPRVIVVLPQGDNGFWVNWWDGTRRYEDWLLLELLPQVQRDYHTGACPEDCHVMGVSMGGTGTMRFALRHPNQFRTATVLSAPIFNTERMLSFLDNRFYGAIMPVHRIFGPPRAAADVAADDPFMVWKRPEDLQVELFLGWAAGDRRMIKASNQELHAHLEAAGIAHHSEEFEGGHKWVSWGPVIERAIAMQVGGDSGAEL